MNIKIVLSGLYLANYCQAWGLPGLMAQDYRKGDQMRVMVGKIESRTTSMPFNYYDAGF